MAQGWLINPENLIHIYPSCYLLAIYVGSGIVLYEVHKRNLPRLPFLITMVWGLVSAICGSKLFTITPAQILRIIETGAMPLTHEKVYLGWLIGGLLGIKVARRIMGFKFDLGDIFAFALPAGFAIMRIGCLFGGCCFGKPANLPWAIRYAQNSPAYNLHLKNGLVNSLNICSLSVHPTQIYEIITMVLIIVLLIKIRTHLKKPGSLFYVYLILHGTTRFVIDFFKEGGTCIYGLKLMQWFLLLFSILGTILLYLRENIFGKVKEEYTVPEDSLLKDFVMFLPAPLFVIINPEWLTPAVYKTLSLMVLFVGIVLGVKLTRFFIQKCKWIIRVPATLATIAILETSLDTTKTQDTLSSMFFVEIDGGAMVGEYVEICGGVYPYHAGGMDVTAFYRDPYETTLGIKLRGYKLGGYDEGYYGLSSSLVIDHRFACFDLGYG